MYAFPFSLGEVHPSYLSVSYWYKTIVSTDAGHGVVGIRVVLSNVVVAAKKAVEATERSL
jgi:hypothetical protein